MDAEIRAGIRDSLQVVIAAAPFGLLFGALAVENGLTTFEAVLMSATVFGGASQMVGIELFGQKVAPWLIVLSIFAVNFRHVLYSASLERLVAPWPFWQKAATFFFLTDPQFAETEARREAGKRVTFAWYFAFALAIYVLWLAESFVGAQFGRLIEDPKALGIDFLLPIYFLGLVMGFRHRSKWLPVVIAAGAVSLVAHEFVGSPWHVSIGAIAGVVLAAALTPRAAEPDADPNVGDLPV